MKSCKECGKEGCLLNQTEGYCLDCPECGVNWKEKKMELYKNEDLCIECKNEFFSKPYDHRDPTPGTIGYCIHCDNCLIKDKKMEFDKSRCFTSLNADELKEGDKVIVAYNLYGLKEQVKMFTESAIDVIEVIQDEDYFNRFKVKHGESFPLAYLVERKENCLKCKKCEVISDKSMHCDWVGTGPITSARVEKCNHYEPKTEQKAEKMNESDVVDWGSNSCCFCDFYNKENHRCLVDRDEVLNPALNTCPHYTPRSLKKCEDCVYHYYEDKFDSICRCNMNDRPTTPIQAMTCNFFLREEAEKHYRPFRDTDELIKVWCEKGSKWQKREITMPFIWVREKGCEKSADLITCFGSKGITVRGKGMYFDTLFTMFEFLDGSPCGVEE